MNASHPIHSADLESLVRRLVVEALRQTSNTSTDSAIAPPGPPATHVLGEAVISLGVLESLPEGVRQVEIAPRAVITPAAADRLREQRISVMRGSSAKSLATASIPAGSTSTGPAAGDVSSAASLAWIADADHPERAAAYVRQLAHRGTTATAANLPLGSQRTGSVGVVLAEVPAVHVDQLARIEGRSAVAVASLSDVSKIAAVMAPAVWVLDSDRLSFSGRIAVAAECFRVSPAARVHSAGVAVGRSR